MKRARILILAVVVIALSVAVSWRALFFYRDNFSTHYPIKDLTATILGAHEIPLWNPAAGGGQPLAGNPNTLTFYPDTLLYLVLPAWVAFDLHFILHVLLGVLAMFALLRIRGVSERAAMEGAALYLVSGVVASSFAFYNLVTAIALIPLELLAVERLLAKPTWRRGLELGAVSGLIGLAGEPAMVFAVAFICVVMAVGRLDGRHRVPVAIAAVTALLVASPLLVAWNEVRTQVERGVFEYSAETVLAASVSPARALEMVAGPFEGVATDGSYVPPKGSKWPPFFLSLYVAALLVPALGVWTPGTWREKTVVVALFAGMLGSFDPLVRVLVDRIPLLRVVRYPEKLALPFTVVAIVLVAMLLDAREQGWGERMLTRGGAALAALGILLAVIGPFDLPVGSRTRLAIGLGVALLTLVCCEFRRLGRVPRIAMFALPALFGAYWLVRTIPVDRVAPYLHPSKVARSVLGERIYRDPTTTGFTMSTPAREEYRARAFEIDPVFGIVDEVGYAGERSPDGMYSYLSRIVSERIDAAPLPVRLRYLRILRCRGYVTTKDLSDPGLRLRDVFDSPVGPLLRVYSIRDTLPTVMTPRAAVGAASVQEAVRALEGDRFDERSTVVVNPAHARASIVPPTIRDVSATSQSIRFHASAMADTIVMLDQTYFDAWTARAGDRRLAIFPADVDRLAVEIPKGDWDVTLRFGRKRGQIVGLTAVSLLLLVLAGVLASLECGRLRPLSSANRP